MPDLDLQLRELIETGAAPVTAREAIYKAGSLAPTFRLLAGVRGTNRRMIGTIAVVAAVIALVVVLVFGFRSSPGPSGGPVQPVAGSSTFVAYLTPDGSISHPQLEKSARVITRRLEDAGLSHAEVRVFNQELRVTSSGSAERTRSVLAGVVDRGVIYFRPVLCSAPAYSGSPTGSTTPSLTLPKSCPPRYELSAANLAVETSVGELTGNPPTWSALANYRSTPLTVDQGKSTALLSTSSESGWNNERLLAGPSALSNPQIASAQAAYQAPEWIVDLNLSSAGAAAWDRLALEQFHAYIAIEYDGTIVSAPLTEPSQSTFSSFDGKVQITFGSNKQTAAGVAAALQTQALPVSFSLAPTS